MVSYTRQGIHNTCRHIILKFIGTEFIIFKNLQEMRNLPIQTNNAGPQTMTQIKIEDPYFLPKSPIFTIPTITSANIPSTPSLEDEFNKNNVTRNLFQIISSFPSFNNGADEINQVELLYNINYYLDYVSALFIQKLLSYVLLYPQRLLEFTKLTDDKARLEKIKSTIKMRKSGLFDYDSDIIIESILTLINAFGRNSDETNLMQLLTNFDKETQFDWTKLNVAAFETNKCKTYTNLDDVFQMLSNLMNPDLISGIPMDKVLTTNTTDLKNDLVITSLDLYKFEILGHLWHDIFSENDVLIGILFLRDELSKIYGYFENSNPANNYEYHKSISLDTINKYLETVLSENVEKKLEELIDKPNSDGILTIFRSLKIDQDKNLPILSKVNFLFTASWLFKETPMLKEFHRRAEEFIFGWHSIPSGVSPNNGTAKSERLNLLIFVDLFSLE